MQPIFSPPQAVFNAVLPGGVKIMAIHYWFSGLTLA